jgi:hypothetical protein
MAVCTHLDQINLTEPADPVEGCEECLKTGGWWVHLRMCETLRSDRLLRLLPQPPREPPRPPR